MKKEKIIPILIPGTGVGLSAINYSESDPQGSYTGLPADIGDTPIQDADDL